MTYSFTLTKSKITSSPCYHLRVYEQTQKENGELQNDFVMSMYDELPKLKQEIDYWVARQG